VMDFISAYAPQIDAGEYPADDATITTHILAMEHLLDESRALGVNTELPELITRFGQRAMAAGHANNSYAAMIEQFRKP